MRLPVDAAPLRTVQSDLCALVEDLNDEDYRAQFHVDLSPIGWHLGHCTFIENYWLREVVLGDDSLTKPLAHYYIPANSPKPQRGPALPPKQDLLDSVRRQQADNLRLLSETATQRHALLKDDYLSLFLLQHHCQHFETINLARHQRALGNGYVRFKPAEALKPAPVREVFVTAPAGIYSIGGARPEAFDNELPAHGIEHGTFDIAARPVNNAEYLRFIEDDGYNARAHWTETGWQWREQTACQRPDHWRQNGRGQWFGIDQRGAFDLSPDAPVYGVSHHEASAFAAYAGARLPHENEWEIACRLGILRDVGRVWEWCGNTFYGYEGFRPFPYDEYSLPWFDGTHYSLRGGSALTRPVVKRASFRNFYTPDKRHIFAGLRLVHS
ncbi:MAG: ergothioneine biosynthesis protein EgtB [Gammaproteobacteria bacterium]|nr:ergothioneine biosynthesis protein EgtB [Gammaproteobacteria bacterium]MBA3732668.1 ergothioneine biosynthesis protein EgtB [Gammaproteobacteria bacterium]